MTINTGGARANEGLVNLLRFAPFAMAGEAFNAKHGRLRNEWYATDIFRFLERYPRVRFVDAQERRF